MTASTELNGSPHALYRFYDESDELLYVGITNNPGRRFAQHSAGRPWWHLVANIRMTRYGSREDVLAAEREAISAEQPRFNVKHANTTPGSPESESQSADVYPVAVDDCVALGLVDSADLDNLVGRDCPVGLVTSVTAWGVQLRFMEWLWGSFQGERTTIPWHRISEIRIATWAMEETDWRGDMLGNKDKLTKVFDTAPLATFQTTWTKGRARAIQDIQARRS